jgi:hypothetical protein
VLVEHKAGYKELKKTIGDRELKLRLDVSTSTPTKPSRSRQSSRS